MTEEEAETLGNMKTEVLKETADPSKGFVISFDDDTPKKPKPVLKQRRLVCQHASFVNYMALVTGSAKRTASLTDSQTWGHLAPRKMCHRTR